MSDRWLIDSAATSTYGKYFVLNCWKWFLRENFSPLFLQMISRLCLCSTPSEIGNSPDERGRELMKKKGITMEHVARQITTEDFRKFDFIFGMDDDNLSNLKRKKPSDSKAVIDYLGSFDPQQRKIIQDPYRGSVEDFVTVYEQCLRCCEAFLARETKWFILWM